jgi:hypothetical protein
MEIKPTYITFEQAKLLKEKGFDVDCTHAYCQSVNLDRPIEHCFPRINQYKPNVKEEWLAPEQWQVVEWLLLNHRLDIIVKYPESNTNKVEGINSVYYDLEIYKLQGGDAHKLYKFIGVSDKKQEAYSAAFDYILNNNLI